MARATPILGLALAALAAVCFAGNTTAARVAYDGGSNPLTYLSLRSMVAFALVSCLVLAVRADLRMAMRRRFAAFGIGLVLALYSYALLSAIQYIPVGLATLIFYTFPLLTSLVLWTSGRERPTALALAALALAAVGLVLALDVGGGRLDPFGVALAGLAAVSITAVVLMSSRLIGGGDSRPVTVHVMASASVVFVAVTLAFGNVAPPETAAGWTGFAAGTVLYAVAITSWFVALSLIGPIPASLTMNLEPVASLLLGFLILGQALGEWQVVGAAVVIAAVLAVRADAARRARQPSGGTS